MTKKTFLFLIFPMELVLLISSGSRGMASELEARSEKRITALACAFQIERQIPPTFCYQGGQTVEEITELDDLCLTWVKRSSVIPAVSPETSSVCRNAIRNRADDLRYARRSGLRAASR